MCLLALSNAHKADSDARIEQLCGPHSKCHTLVSWVKVTPVPGVSWRDQGMRCILHCSLHLVALTLHFSRRLHRNEMLNCSIALRKNGLATQHQHSCQSTSTSLIGPRGGCADWPRARLASQAPSTARLQTSCRPHAQAISSLVPKDSLWLLCSQCVTCCTCTGPPSLPGFCCLCLHHFQTLAFTMLSAAKATLHAQVQQVLGCSGAAHITGCMGVVGGGFECSTGPCIAAVMQVLRAALESRNMSPNAWHWSTLASLAHTSCISQTAK